MNKKLVTAAVAGAFFLAGCAKSTPVAPTEYPEYYVACYKGDRFVKMDDDCYDDGLTVGPRPSHIKVKVSFKPMPTSRPGMKIPTGTSTGKTSTATGIGSSKRK